MTPMASVGNGLQAALLLARGRPDGMKLLATGEATELTTAIRSFWAAALCLPAFVCLLLIDLPQEKLPAHAAHGFALQLLGYVISWAGYALLTRWLAGTIGRDATWPRFIAAWNWCNVIQYLLLVAASLPMLVGLPDIVGQTARLVATGWSLWLEWYATRLALEVTGTQAAGLVLLDEAMGFGLLAIIGALPGGTV